jgi:hypothetical protein
MICMSTCHRAHLVIGKHHLDCCLHIFTMATVLKRGKKIPLNFPSGTILALKPTPLAKAPASLSFAISLHNEKGDTLLSIWFSSGHIIFNDRARRSLGDGWGKKYKVDMTHMDLKGRSLLEVTVSIYHYLTDSEFGRYQILFNGITIAHFQTRFRGPATWVDYWVGDQSPPRGPPSWNVDVYQIDDLLPEERLALAPGRYVDIGQYSFIPDETSGPPRHQFLVLIQWQFLFGHPISFQLKHMHPSVGMIGKRYVFYNIESWSSGLNSPRSESIISDQEIFYKSMLTRRVRVGIAGIMEISICSRSSWIPLQIFLLYATMMIPSVSTTKASDNIPFGKHPQHNSLKIDPNTNYIRTVYQRGPTKRWKEAQPITNAIKGSSIAIIKDPTIKRVSRIYYQDPELHLKECCYGHFGTMGQWVLGEQVPKLCLSTNGHPSHVR